MSEQTMSIRMTEERGDRLVSGLRTSPLSAGPSTESSLGMQRMTWEVAPFGIGEWGSLDRFEPDGNRPFFVSNVLAGEIASEDDET